VNEAVREVTVRRALHGREVVGREDRTLDDAVAQIGEKLGEPIEYPFGHLVPQPATLAPWRFAREEEAVGRREGESLRREGRVHDGGDLHRDRRMLGELAEAAGLVARLLKLGIRDDRRVEAGAGIGVQVLERRAETG